MTPKPQKSSIVTTAAEYHKSSGRVAKKPKPLTFHDLPLKLPLELTSHILESWIGSQRLVVDQVYTFTEARSGAQSPSSTITNLLIENPRVFNVRYACATDKFTQNFPSHLQLEYWRLRHLSWLKSIKTFDSPYDFYISHWILSLNLMSAFPAYPFSAESDLELCDHPVAIDGVMTDAHPDIYAHGLERVELNFDAAQYFALFGVTLPPSEKYGDAALCGAAELLLYTQHLMLRFGDAYRWANPWAETQDPAWDDAKYRAKVCEAGLVIDWILEFAWEGGFLQHIETIELVGDVQPWVRRKWEGIFERQAEARRSGSEELFAVHRPDTEALGTRGMVKGKEEEWEPEEHFPPMCQCEVGCWRLRNGEVTEEEPLGAEMMDWESMNVGKEAGVVGTWDIDGMVNEVAEERWVPKVDVGTVVDWIAEDWVADAIGAIEE